MGQQKIKAAVSSTVIAALLAGCGGGAQPTPSVVQNGSPASVSYVVKVPAGSSLAKAVRTRNYTSRDAKGIGLRGGQHGTVTFPNTAAALKDYSVAGGHQGYAFTLSPTHTYTGANSGSETCTAAASDGSFTCTITIPGAQGGYVDAQIALFDTAPSVEGQGGTFSGNALSVGTMTNALVLTGQSTTFSFTLSGVVNSVQLQSSLTSFVVGTAANTTLSAVAKDAAGDIIIGSDHYVDAGGNSLTLTMNASPNAHFTYTGGTTFTSPADSVPVHYDGVDPSATSEAFTIATAVLGTNTGATVSVTKLGSGSIGIPGAPSYTALTAVSGGVQGAFGVATDFSGNIWGTSYNQSVESWDAGTYAHDKTVSIGAGVRPWSIARAAGGNMCFTDQNSSNVWCFDPTAGAPSATGYATTGVTWGLTQGPDGNLWFTDSANKVGVLTAPGLVTEVSTTPDALNSPNGIASGPDGNLWIASSGSGQVVLVNPVSQKEVTAYAVGSTPYLLASDGTNMWVTRHDASGTVVRVTPSGTATNVAAGIGILRGVALGPDRNIYVSSESGAIAVINPVSAAVVKTYTLNSSDIFSSLFFNPNDGNMYVSSGNTPQFLHFKP